MGTVPVYESMGPELELMLGRKLAREVVAYLEGRPHAPKGADWDAALADWRQLRTDDDAVFDHEVVIDASTLAPFVTWGTNPGQGVPLSATVPSPDDFNDPVDIGSLIGIQFELGRIRDETIFIRECILRLCAVE